MGHIKNLKRNNKTYILNEMVVQLQLPEVSGLLWKQSLVRNLYHWVVNVWKEERKSII